MHSARSRPLRRSPVLRLFVKLLRLGRVRKKRRDADEVVDRRKSCNQQLQTASFRINICRIVLAVFTKDLRWLCRYCSPALISSGELLRRRNGKRATSRAASLIFFSRDSSRRSVVVLCYATADADRSGSGVESTR